MITTEHECSQEVRGHDKACEKFHLGPPVAIQSYHALETRSTGQEKAPPERGAGAALGAVLLCPHKAPLVAPPIHAAQHERAGRAGLWASAAGSTAGLLDPKTASGNAILHAQDSASTAATPQREPRKPLAGTRKPRRQEETPAGP